MMAMHFVTLLFLSSCDRDGPMPSDEGKIIGKWDTGHTTHFNLDGTLHDHAFNDEKSRCPYFPFIVFRSDNTLNFQFIEKTLPELCSPTEKFSPEGRWERLGNEKYRIFLEGRNGYPDTIMEPERIYFTQGDSIMKIQFEPVIDNGVDKPYYMEASSWKYLGNEW